MTYPTTRREFIRRFGLSAAALPFVWNLPGLGFANQSQRKQRLVVMFSPNGVIPDAFWPNYVDPKKKDDKKNDKSAKAAPPQPTDKLNLPHILEPLAPYKNRTLVLDGVCDKIRGDGDNHMRGMGCLLTGVELFPGNIQGGSHTPAGWSSGISIDQELKNFLHANPATRTRFGSLEYGIMVPDRADTWTRMSYAGPNRPIAPIDDPYQMFHKLYGRAKDNEHLRSVLDGLDADLKKVSSIVGKEDRRLLEEHAAYVREMEQELAAESQKKDVGHVVPQLEPGVKEENDRIPQISKMQIDLMVAGFAADFNRVATLQYTNSVGQAKMHWLGIDEGHHELSHEPDSNKSAVEKLTKINRWFCEQLAYLTKRLAETPEPGGQGSLLDNTTIIWTNELGKGNSHTLDNIPFVLVGDGLGFKMDRALKLPKVAHNRLLLSIAHSFGHRITKFGNPDYCGEGPLSLT
ncbi:MAG: DUF1552 domain-containing protein [Planctomycetaceae bacterium]|nr:DUF1552 domain-containing protein [Planctomycetaceae bacterium]